MFTRRDDTTIELDIAPLRPYLLQLLEVVERAAVETTSPSHQRLYGPINPDLVDDDPLARLEREIAMESSVALVRAQLDAPTITVEDARCWISVLSLAAAAIAAEYGVVDDETRATLDEGTEVALRLASYVQVHLVEAISPGLVEASFEGLDPLDE